jgi:hypothetical protein
MKGNMESLTALAQRVEAIEKSKEDYIVHTSAIRMEDDNHIAMQGTPANPYMYGVNDVAQNQIVERMRPKLKGIRKEYWDSMAAIPGLRAYTVNSWLAATPERRMVRTLDGNVRAFLSDSFKPWDNMDMLAGLLPVLQRHPIEVRSCSLSERRMYLQVVFPQITAEVKVGDWVRAGLTFSNSEVGEGAWDVRAWIEVLRCMNGMVGESLIRKYHVGRRVEDAEDGIFKSDTIEADIHAAKLQLRDVVENALDLVKFETKVKLIQGAAEDRIEKPLPTIERVTKRFNFSDGEGESILNNLIKGGEATRWGLSNAITAMAHDITNPDRQYDVEQVGWDIIDLKPTEWKTLTN